MTKEEEEEEDFSVVDYLGEAREAIERILEEKDAELLGRLRNVEEEEEEEDGCPEKNCSTPGDLVRMLSLVLDSGDLLPKLSNFPGGGRGGGGGDGASQESERRREEGNRLLREGDAAAALAEYNAAAVAAWTGGKEDCLALALALSNRSVCLAKMGRGELAEKDVRRQVQTVTPARETSISKTTFKFPERPPIYRIRVATAHMAQN